MLTNFEELTQELTDDEMRLLPYVVAGFKSKTVDNPIKAPDIVASLNKYLEAKNITGIKMTEVRLRKFVHHIRATGSLPLIATSRGYFCSQDPEQIEKQIKSLEERARSIKECARGLKYFL